ncbi:hypothetical protein [Gracilibacillus sp. YIM 98692]|uniref:hypothetical protein n=1 Tax=Gracilibacillus sp. YIM 98692 TaxID=2663532 RepID=UPI0013D0F6D9|nr:hypothetical protein [Gracilibacillus sp. YIM 98692]
MDANLLLLLVIGGVAGAIIFGFLGCFLGLIIAILLYISGQLSEIIMLWKKKEESTEG